ncbi:MAG: gamma-glutamyltransferase, partial [Burkholderiales bacterium]
PENRDPQDVELAACANYLERQIEAINPLIILTLGRFSMARYFQTAKISAIHGKASWVGERMIVAMYHPAAGLHQPNLKVDIMHDFSLLPGLPNAYRLRGGAANAVAAGKRPLSSMTPTFVEDAKGVLILGSPGGSRIVSQVLLAVREYARMTDVDLARLVSMPRYHHQYWPDRIEIEPEGFSKEWQAAMAAKGHSLRVSNRRWGNMQVVLKATRNGAAVAASDPRGEGVAWY